MNLLTSIDSYEPQNVLFCETIKNNIIPESDFVRILYSTPIMTINGIYLHVYICMGFYSRLHGSCILFILLYINYFDLKTIYRFSPQSLHYLRNFYFPLIDCLSLDCLMFHLVIALANLLNISIHSQLLK